MSKKEEFWNHLTVKNPKLLDNPHFTENGIKQFFNAVYNRAYDDGFYMAKKLDQGYSSDGAAIFEQIFGKQ